MMEETAELERRAAAFYNGVRAEVATWAEEVQTTIYRRVDANIGADRAPTGKRSASSTIGSRRGSGGVADLLRPGARGNTSDVTIAGEEVIADYGIDLSGHRYVLMHLTGGTITPRSAKALTVPASEEAVEAAERAGGNLRSLDLVVIKPKGRTAYLASRADVEKPLFWLVKKVTIPKRDFWTPSLEAFMREDADRIGSRFMSTVLERFDVI